MRWNPFRFIGSLPRIAIITICVVIAGGLAAGILIWQARQHPTMPQASCGQAVTHLPDSDTQLLGADSGALTCFTTAVQRCMTASIGVTAMGVDAGTSYVFTVVHGGEPCQITELMQGYGWSGGYQSGPITSVPCRLTAVTGRGVDLNCGGQGVLIPSAVTAS